MTTEKLYLNFMDTQGAARVTSVSPDRLSVRLHRTLFHPRGGGQPADTGWIGKVAVIDVRHAEGGQVDHLLAAPADFGEGDDVLLRVDADRRALNAAWHSAGHLVADAVKLLRPAWTPVQGHHWPGEGRVEFTASAAPDLTPDGGFDDKLAELIASDLPIQIVGDPYLDRRIRIGDFAPIPCGGTHRRSTGSLGRVCVTKLKLRDDRIRASYSVH